MAPDYSKRAHTCAAAFACCAVLTLALITVFSNMHTAFAAPIATNTHTCVSRNAQQKPDVSSALSEEKGLLSVQTQYYRRWMRSNSEDSPDASSTDDASTSTNPYLSYTDIGQGNEYFQATDFVDGLFWTYEDPLKNATDTAQNATFSNLDRYYVRTDLSV